jgi:hypothetical protein
MSLRYQIHGSRRGGHDTRWRMNVVDPLHLSGFGSTLGKSRLMPGVCGVLMSSSLAWTTRTPLRRHLESVLLSIAAP